MYYWQYVTNVFLSDLLQRTKIFTTMLYLIGLGLGNVDDITMKGMATVQKCSRVYLETYTSIMSFGLDKMKLEEFFGKKIEEADRTTIELDSSNFINLFYLKLQNSRRKCSFYLS